MIPPPVCPPEAGLRGRHSDAVRRYRLTAGHASFTDRRTETGRRIIPLPACQPKAGSIARGETFSCTMTGFKWSAAGRPRQMEG